MKRLRVILLVAMVALVCGVFFVWIWASGRPVRVTLVSLHPVPGSKNTLAYAGIENRGNKVFHYWDIRFVSGDRMNSAYHQGGGTRLKSGDLITNVVGLPFDGGTGRIRAFGYYPGRKLPAPLRFAQPLLDRYNARRAGTNYFDSEELIVAPHYDGDALLRPAMVLRPDGSFLSNAPPRLPCPEND